MRTGGFLFLTVRWALRVLTKQNGMEALPSVIQVGFSWKQHEVRPGEFELVRFCCRRCKQNEVMQRSSMTCTTCISGSTWPVVRRKCTSCGQMQEALGLRVWCSVCKTRQEQLEGSVWTGGCVCCSTDPNACVRLQCPVCANVMRTNVPWTAFHRRLKR